MAQQILPVSELLGHIAGRLREAGYRQMYRSPGGSRYFAHKSAFHFRLRVSNHPWSTYQYWRHPEVICSVCLQPATQGEVPALVERIIQDFDLAFERRKLSRSVLTPEST